MANISYGVNIIPKTNNAYTLGNSDYKWSNIYAVQLNGINVANLATNSIATSSAAGLMSAADKAKLDTLSTFNATDYTVNIMTTDWVNNSYIWTNSAVTSTAHIIVNFTPSVKDYVKGTLEYDKVTGGVLFDVESTPTGTITLIVTVMDGTSGPASGADIDDTSTALNKTWSSQKINELIIIGNTLPLSDNNKIWINNSTETEISVPTYSEFTTALGGKVDDILINGTSIKSNGVANIPIADNNTFGVVKTNYNDGIGISSDTGALTIKRAASSAAKSGTDAYAILTSYWQHEYAFYGLAKAAGDSTQSASSNTVGIYTPEAKIAIQKMLGIYEAPWELIKEGSYTNNEAAEYTISTDSNGDAFQLTDTILVLVIPTLANAAIIGSYGRVWYYNGTTNFRTAYLLSNSSLTINASSNDYIAFAVIELAKGLMKNYWSEWRVKASHTYLLTVNGSDSDGVQTAMGLKDTYIDSIKIAQFTGTMNYRLLGRRKWN